MNLNDKLAHAEYFMNHMLVLEAEYQDHYHHFPDSRPQAPCEQQRKVHYSYEFAAFLASARSVLLYIFEHRVKHSEADAWVQSIGREPLIRCFKKLRDVEVHVEMLSSDDAWIVGPREGEFIGPYFIINNEALEIPRLANDSEAKRELVGKKLTVQATQYFSRLKELVEEAATRGYVGT